MTTPAPRGRDLLIASLSAIGSPSATISRELECSPRTVTRARARHRAWITEQRDITADETAAALLAMNAQAIRALTELIASAQDAVRFGAARFIVESSLKWRDQVDVERRLQALEAEEIAKYVDLLNREGER
jgi:hypothetical protein